MVKEVIREVIGEFINNIVPGYSIEKMIKHSHEYGNHKHNNVKKSRNTY